MDVTETWNIDITDTNTLYKTFKKDKTKYSQITNVVVKDENNQELTKSDVWKYHLNKGSYYGGINNDGLFEISWGVGLDNSSATKTYNISYKVEDAIAKYSDYAELYWQFVGEDFEISSEKITGEIYLPSNAENISEIKVWGHTEDLNGNIYATSTNKIEFNIYGFRAGRYVEIRSLFPTEMIAYSNREEQKTVLQEVIEEETNWANEANAKREMRRKSKIIIAIVIDVVGIIITILIIKSIKKYSKKAKETIKIKPTQEIEYFREIPRENATPAEALALHTKSIGEFGGTEHLGKIFSATLLNLGLKKLIDFQVNGKDIKIKILKQIVNEQETEKDERQIFEFLKQACDKETGEVTIKELKKFIEKHSQAVINLKDTIDEVVASSLYEKQLADKQAKQEYDNVSNSRAGYVVLLFALAFISMFAAIILSPLVLLGTVLCIITTIIQLITLSSYLKKINILTQKGVDERSKWEGLIKYMQDFSMLDKREVPELVIWEKFMVYATVFGIAEKVIKQLKIVYPNFEKEVNINTYGYMYLMMNTNFSNSFTKTINNSMSSVYSSATGGGGGFSGGGGGGGRTVVDGGGR